MTSSDQTASEPPAVDRAEESADMIETPEEDDTADLTGSAATGTAGQMHDEVDDIAGQSDNSAGHGPSDQN